MWTISRHSSEIRSGQESSEAQMRENETLRHSRTRSRKVPGRALKVAISMSAIAFAASCSRGMEQTQDIVTVKVSEDARNCSILDQTMPCSALPSHLTSMGLSPETTIVLSDAKTGRTDDALALLGKKLRDSGLTRVIIEISFITGPR